jgi:hypothetical protein
MAWFDDLAGVSGARVLDEARLEAWPDRAMDSRLHQLRFCPATAPELYQLARHLPLTIVEEDDIPCVMVDLRPEELRRPAFDAGGALLRSYRPAISRLLPYFATAQGRPMRLVDTAGPADIPRPPELRQQLALMLRAQATGISQLTEAATILIAEGLLSPRQSGNGPVEWHPLPKAEIPDPLPRLSGPPAPAVFLALRLLAVLEFTRMHRREDSPQTGGSNLLRTLLSRDDALRNQTFLTRDEALDFSAFLPKP